MITSRKNLVFGIAALTFLIGGCSTTQKSSLATIQSELEAEKQRNAALASEIQQTKSDLATQSAKLAGLNSDSSTGGNLLPPNAKPGECYSRVLVPATYKSEAKQVLESEATEKLEIIPAQYDTVEQTVLVKEASETAELIPAKYEWTVESVMVKEAQEELRVIPAEYTTETEQVLVKPAYTTWKKGRGPIERTDNSTGEIMCLVDVPAEYKTVTKTTLASPARTEKVVIPAEYNEVKKRVMVEPPKLAKVEIPAEYKTIKVRKLVVPAKETRVEIPATYQTVTNQVKTSDSYLEWRSILCETNTTPDVVRRIQNGLSQAGYNPGPIDGLFGSATLSAVKSFQIDKGLAQGQLTMETLKSLGVEL